ncbi:MAG: hypothetical protein IPH77_14360 [Ignavibacteria bacterium]|nr:hypothetical protein [Ignavibacteria bacterium]
MLFQIHETVEANKKLKDKKNPMAMRTMHELRKLVNYLLEINKIDNETNIVIELARELNDSNLRKAIRFWQNDKETEKSGLFQSTFGNVPDK